MLSIALILEGAPASNLFKRNDFVLLAKDEQSRNLQLVHALSFTDDSCTANKIVID